MPSQRVRRALVSGCCLFAACSFVACGAKVDNDPWIRPQKCTVENRSSSAIMKVFLRCLDPAWETTPIDVLQPGESKEISLPDGGIPVGFVEMIWMISEDAEIGGMMKLSKSKNTAKSAIHFVITDGGVQLE